MTQTELEHIAHQSARTGGGRYLDPDIKKLIFVKCCRCGAEIYRQSKFGLDTCNICKGEIERLNNLSKG